MGKNNSHSSLSNRQSKKSDFEAEKRKMKFLIVTLIGLVASSFAAPQYGSSGGSGRDDLTNGNRPSPNLPAGCRIEYKTVYDIVENEKFETQCTTKFKKQCTEKYNRVCTPWTETVCKTLNENICETKYRDNCYEKYRDIKEPYEEDVCVDKDIAVCDKHWQCNNPNIPISDCNDKVWVDNKETCQYLKRTFCEPVQKYRTVKQPYQHCDNESWQDCKDVPYKKCDDYARNDCKDVPYQDCNQVPWQDCEEVHFKVPEQVSQKRPFRVCDGQAGGNNDPYRYSDQEIADYDFIELRTGAVDTDAVDAEDKQVEEVTTKKSSSAITFG